MSREPDTEDKPASWFKFSDDSMAEKADFIVCMLESQDPKAFTDNLVAKCCRCKRRIIYRPSAPKAPKKICMACVNKEAQKRLNQHEED